MRKKKIPPIHPGEVLLEAAAQQKLDGGGRAWRQETPIGVALEDGGDAVGGRLAGESKAAGKALEEDAAE